jgi:hypothetical protein
MTPNPDIVPELDGGAFVISGSSMIVLTLLLAKWGEDVSIAGLVPAWLGGATIILGVLIMVFGGWRSALSPWVMRGLGLSAMILMAILLFCEEGTYPSSVAWSWTTFAAIVILMTFGSGRRRAAATAVTPPEKLL